MSGYNLDSLLPENGFDLARALVGSEGTLVTVLHAELELVPVPTATALVVLGYPDIVAAAATPCRAVLEHEPSALEGMDHRARAAGARRAARRRRHRRRLPAGAAG